MIRGAYFQQNIPEKATVTQNESPLRVNDGIPVRLRIVLKIAVCHSEKTIENLPNLLDDLFAEETSGRHAHHPNSFKMAHCCFTVRDK